MFAVLGPVTLQKDSVYVNCIWYNLATRGVWLEYHLLLILNHCCSRLLQIMLKDTRVEIVDSLVVVFVLFIVVLLLIGNWVQEFGNQSYLLPQEMNAFSNINTESHVRRESTISGA